MFYIRMCVSALLSAILLSASLFAWEMAHPSGGMAALVFVPLAVSVLVAHFLVHSRLYRARMDAELQPDTFLRYIPAGHLKTLTRAVLFIPASFAVLAFETLYSGLREMVLAFLLCGLSGAAFLFLRASLMPAHFRTPYDDAKAAGLGALVGAVPFAVVVCLLVLSGDMSGDVRHEELGDWILANVKDRIPAPEGLKAALLGAVFDVEAAGEAARQKLVDYLGGAEWVRMLYCAYGAVVCLIIARMGVFCAMSIQCAMALLGIGDSPSSPAPGKPAAGKGAKPGRGKGLRNSLLDWVACLPAFPKGLWKRASGLLASRK